MDKVGQHAFKQNCTLGAKVCNLCWRYHLPVLYPMPLPCAGVIKSKFDSLILVYCGACLYWLLGLHSLLCDLIVALSKAALPKWPGKGALCCENSRRHEQDCFSPLLSCGANAEVSLDTATEPLALGDMLR